MAASGVRGVCRGAKTDSSAAGNDGAVRLRRCLGSFALSKPVLIETLRIISATAPDIEKHRNAVIHRFQNALLARAEVASALALCPAELFVPALLDGIVDLASGVQVHSPADFVRSLLLAGASGHVTMEEALLESLKAGLGPIARPILLHAWGAGFWLLVASYRIRQNH